MDPDILTEIIASKLQDYADQYRYLMTIGKFRDAQILAQEGEMIARAYDCNDIFLVLCDAAEA